MAETLEIKDLYSVLGLKEGATNEELKKSYRKLSKTMHPDISKEPDAEEKFLELTFAYETLTNPDRLEEYKEEMEKASSKEITYNKMIHSIRRARNPRSPIKGEDVILNMPFYVSEVLQEIPIETSFDRFINCKKCKGHGYTRDLEHFCAKCSGSGSINVSSLTPFGGVQFTVPCSECEGKGYKEPKNCDECEKGKVSKIMKIYITLRNDIQEKMTQVFTGKGDEGLNGGPAGDAIVNFYQAADDPYTIQGTDLKYTVKVPFETYIKGGEIDIPLPTGKVGRIPFKAGEMPTHITTIPDCGLPTSNGFRGVLILSYEIEAPVLTEEQLNKMKEIL